MNPVRVLHVIGRMDRAGAETWLMHVLRATDRRCIAMDFLVHSEQPGEYDAEIRRLGSRIIPCHSPSRPVSYARKLADVLRHDGPYDVIHSHVHHYSGLVLAVARLVGVPVRIAHSHLDTSSMDASAGALRGTYVRLMDAAIRRFSTAGLAASGRAAAALFGRQWPSDRRFRVLSCGLDYAAFHQLPDRSTMRRELALPEDALVVGHVGRFFPQKNHALILRIAAELSRRNPRTWFVLVGDGPLRRDVEAQVTASGLSDRFLFAGIRPDVPRILSALDAFLFPSSYEGLGLAGVEAQAAGVPVVLSDTIPEEIEVVHGLVHWCSLSASPGQWASALEVAARARRPTQADALAQVEASPFSINTSLQALQREYFRVPSTGPMPEISPR